MNQIRSGVLPETSPASPIFTRTDSNPCKVVAPILENLVEEYEGKVDIYKVDTEKEQELASMFNIRSIPSILFVPKDGKPQMSMGALPKENFVQAIKDVLQVPEQTVS